MIIKKHRWICLFLLAVGMMGLLLSGCQPHLRTEQAAHTAAASQTALNLSGAENQPACLLPQTGQRRKLMAGDDGDLKAGRAWPIPRFVANGNGTVTDRLTGLMWSRNADQAHGPAAWEDAVSGAGSCKVGGYYDWRLPNRRELESLLDLDKFNPALPQGHPFIDVQPSYYWTATTTANSEDDAWAIHLYIGFVTKDDKAGSHYVWYVRSGG